MMNLYILASGLMFLMFAIIWKGSNILNVLIKFTFYVLTMWSAYLLLGPTNLIAQLGN